MYIWYHPSRLCIKPQISTPGRPICQTKYYQLINFQSRKPALYYYYSPTVSTQLMAPTTTNNTRLPFSSSNLTTAQYSILSVTHVPNKYVKSHHPHYHPTYNTPTDRENHHHHHRHHQQHCPYIAAVVVGPTCLILLLCSTPSWHTITTNGAASNTDHHHQQQQWHMQRASKKSHVAQRIYIWTCM